MARGGLSFALKALAQLLYLMLTVWTDTEGGSLEDQDALCRLWVAPWWRNRGFAVELSRSYSVKEIRALLRREQEVLGSARLLGDTEIARESERLIVGFRRMIAEALVKERRDGISKADVSQVQSSELPKGNPRKG